MFRRLPRHFSFEGTVLWKIEFDNVLWQCETSNI